jgi:hypothetical protein
MNTFLSLIKKLEKDIKFLSSSFSFGLPKKNKAISPTKYKSLVVNGIPIDIYYYPSFTKNGEYVLKTPYNKNFKVSNQYEGSYHLYSKIDLPQYKNYTLDDNGIYNGKDREYFIEQINKDTDPNFIIALIVNLYYCLVERLDVYINKYGKENINEGHARSYLFTKKHIQGLVGILKKLNIKFDFLDNHGYTNLIKEFEKIQILSETKETGSPKSINKKLVFDDVDTKPLKVLPR